MTDLDVLSTLLNTTFAKCSSPNGTRSIVASFGSGLDGNAELTIKYQTIFHFANDGKFQRHIQQHTLREQTARSENESLQLINDRLASLKTQFKEATGRTLKLVEVSQTDSVEFLPTTMHSPRKSAYYRRIHKFQIKS